MTTQFAKEIECKEEDPIADIFYDAKGSGFYYPRTGGGWINLNQSGVRDHLENRGVDRTQIRELICRIQIDQAIDHAGAIAGQRCGLMNAGGRKILVTSEAFPILPIQGDCSFTLDFIHQLFYLDEEVDEQYHRFLFWLKVSSESLRKGVYRPAQCLILCGPRECGKTLLLTLISKIFGGRVGKPYQYMTQTTSFNGELAGAEFLTIDDEVASADIRSRRKLGQNIKSMIYGDGVQIHPKNREAFTARPWWRVAIACNDEEEAIQILPTIDVSMEDKLMAFRCGKANLPPSETTEQRNAINQRFDQELPALIAYLDSLVIPQDLKCQRNGVKAFIHPWIKDTLEKMGPEVALASLIAEELKDQQAITIIAKDLERQLKTGVREEEARSLLKGHSTCGKYLARLSHLYPKAVKQSGKAQGGVIRWEIDPTLLGELVG